MKDHQILLDSAEAYLRRASELDMPFMVKGSIITRQYFPYPEMRYVGDLDFVFLDFIDDDRSAGRIFSDWVTQVTEISFFDRVEFRSFRKNKFWRRIDYAMNDDFPTVNTDLLCWVNGVMNDRFKLDISYNLCIDFPPVEILYKPRLGEPFLLKNTCPLSLQVSWKLHQLITRPRLKDVFDLIFLIDHENFDHDTLVQALYALRKECKKDNVDVKKLKWYIDGRMEEYHKLEEQDKTNTERWKYLDEEIFEFDDIDIIGINQYDLFTDKKYFKYDELSDIFHDFSIVLKRNGLRVEVVDIL